MFKKKKNKNRDEAAKNAKNLAKKCISPTPSREPTDILDDTDGFDENGFVDLQPIESDGTLLGPRQKCKYVGTFAVITGADGQKTLKTHQERTSYVKYHLSEYRHKSHGVDVVLQTSSDGIKVLSSDSKKVRMAYPLQRITFATCDPDFKLYAFMTNSPTPMGVAVHGHVFVGRSSTQVQELTAMIGRAFKLAFASAKLQKNPRYNTGDLVSSPHKPARRWAKHEAVRGHDLSEHAELAKEKRRGLKAKRSNSPVTETDSSPVLEKKNIGKGGWRGKSPSAPSSQGHLKECSTTMQSSVLSDDVMSDSISSMSMSSSSSMVSSSSYRTENGETRTIVSETQVTREFESQTSSVNSQSLPYSPHKVSKPKTPSERESERDQSPSIDTTGPPLPPRRYKNERPVTQYLMDDPTPDADGATAAAAPDEGSVVTKDQNGDMGNASGDDVKEREKETYLMDDPTPDGDEATAAAFPDEASGVTKDQNGDMGNVSGEDVHEGDKDTHGGEESNITTSEKIESADRLTTHQDAYWYMPGIPREFIMDMLQTSEEGSFFVRNSQSRKGCHALTVRVPTDFQPEGYGNYLITPVPEGVKLEGFSKAFPDLTSLIEYHAQHADGLPCKLLLTGSGVPSDNSEDEEDYTADFEPVDPDYHMLSEFRSMMDELKE